MFVQRDDALAALLSGQVIGLPTETVYGLAARGEAPRACERIFSLKGRRASVALPVAVHDLAAGVLLVAGATDAFVLLAETFWPGPLTLVVRRAPGLHFELGGDEETIGLRCPDNAFVRSLCALAGPLAMTSANRHGEAPCRSADEVRAVFGDQVPLVIDAGLVSGQASTVVSLVEKDPVCLREGPIAFDAVTRILQARHEGGRG